MKFRMALAAFFAALLALPTVSAPAQAAITNGRVTDTCYLAGTYWNISLLYHRNSANGAVQGYGYRAYHGIGPGTLTKVSVRVWSTSAHNYLEVGRWGGVGTNTTDTGDAPFFGSVAYEADQMYQWLLYSNSSSGVKSVDCYMSIT